LVIGHSFSQKDDIHGGFLDRVGCLLKGRVGTGFHPTKVLRRFGFGVPLQYLLYGKVAAMAAARTMAELGFRRHLAISR